MTQFDLFTTHKTTPTVADHKTAPLHGRFYNTTGLTDQDLINQRRRVSGQTERILKVFEQHPHTAFSPWDVYYHLGQQAMITSVRRAITDLTSEGYLQKCERKRSGPANEWNWTWKLKAK